MIKLGKRLSAIVNLTEPVNKMVDVGCDHGYISIALIQRALCSHVIAADVNEGPLSAASENIRAYGLQEYITTRLSDGLTQIAVSEADGMICAGMGGRLMLKILEDGSAKTQVMEELILQPQSELKLFRKTLGTKGYVILREDMVEEDGKFYPMMAVQYNPQKALTYETDAELCEQYGEKLLLSGNPVLKQYLLKERKEIQQILQKMEENHAENSQPEKFDEMNRKQTQNERALSFFTL